eukprot:TRINITY_DN3774_c0_g1_i1.p2 TRINITY_DN3774_c0_g1~~TRINITY_DN3774_c0_g1_i1.p2  ORF type:complete len:121 (+),score=25.99 TRINITY_DN3774_c0_g1_i1:400-762(+)
MAWLLAPSPRLFVDLYMPWWVPVFISKLVFLNLALGIPTGDVPLWSRALFEINFLKQQSHRRNTKRYVPYPILTKAEEPLVGVFRDFCETQYADLTPERAAQHREAAAKMCAQGAAYNDW